MFGLTPLRRTFDAALRDLRSPRAEVRASAAHDLGLVGDEDPRRAADAVAPLADDDSSDVRGAALTALGVLRARQHVERIAARLEDGDSTVRQLAAMALAEVGGERALAALRSAATSPRADVRFQGLLGVLALDAGAGFPLALDALAGSDAWIASEAAEQLGRLFAADPEARTENALGEAERARALEGLRAHLDDADARVAVAAAMALLRAGDEAGGPRVCAFVRTVGTVAGRELRDLAVDAIELLGGVSGEARERAREALTAVAWRVVPTPERAAARAALARMGDPRATEEIVLQLRSLLPGRREAAVRMARLARLGAAEGALLGLLEGGGADEALVIDALGALGGERSRQALDRLARADGRAELRDAARRALASIEERTP
ncbi:MAG: HEAT repeat domain-containing protein [Polyangiales bacterium]